MLGFSRVYAGIVLAALVVLLVVLVVVVRLRHACDGTSLVWTTVYPGLPESELARIARCSLTTGPMKGAMFGWDGEELHEVGVAVHTIKGPTTPDYTLRLPPSITSELGVQTGPNGEVGVRHP